MAKSPGLRDTTVLCSRCQQLFSTQESLGRISDDIPTRPYCRFADLGSWGPCSLCTILAEALRSSSYAGRQVLTAYDPEKLEGQVMLRFSYQMSMADDYDDETSELCYDARPPDLDVFLCNETTGEVELSGQLGWYAIPDRVVDALGLAKSSAMPDWLGLQGFYDSAEYWRETLFTQPVADMIDECRRTHTHCRAKDVPLLPSLVIDVSASSVDGTVRLCAPNQGQRAEYVALSYCWGGPQKLVTTLANHAHLKQGFELSRLPRTIMDAVQVTASLGFRYIWVDALCIVQDDEATKALEIEKMGGIYGNATITLLAASGTCRGADDGLLNSYRDISIVPYYFVPTQEVIPVCLAVGAETAPPLDMRAWTYQERHLTSRRLVFRGPRGVSLSCSGSSNSYTSEGWKRDTNNWYAGGHIACGGDPTTQWHYVFEDYSFRALTFATDRLPAIAAFAADHAPNPGDVYIAGMWKNQIIDDLMWKGQLPTSYRIPLDKYRSPGWSWVSVLDHVPNRTVGFVKNDLRRRIDGGGREENVASYVSHSLQLAQPNARFGRVLNGKITLRAKVISVASAQQMIDVARLRNACNYQLTDDQEAQLELLLTKFCSRWSMEVAGEVEQGYATLIILPGDNGNFKRLGAFWAWEDSADRAKLQQMIDWDNVEYREVTLV